MTERAPITLSGKVYVSAYLAPYYPDHKLPAVLERGDIRVDSHLDDRGRANRQAKTKKARMRGFSGFFTGVIWDGEAWRKFKIAAIVGSDGWYTSQKWKQMKIHGVIWSLQSVAGRVVVVGDGAYVLSAATPAVVAPPSAPPSIEVQEVEFVPAPSPAKVQKVESEPAPALVKPVQLSLF